MIRIAASTVEVPFIGNCSAKPSSSNQQSGLWPLERTLQKRQDTAALHNVAVIRRPFFALRLGFGGAAPLLMQEIKPGSFRRTPISRG